MEEFNLRGPTVLNISNQFVRNDEMTHALVTVSFRVFSASSDSHYQRHLFRILAYQKRSPCGGIPSFRLRFPDNNLFL